MDLSNTVGIVAGNSVDYIETAFSALRAGKIVVPLRSSHDEQRVEATRPKEILTPKEKKEWFKLSFSAPRDTELLQKPAQISFTSGTEGKPKGVILSHAALNDVIERLQMTMNVTHDIREYIGVPVYHSFGYGRCRLISTVGGVGFIPEEGFNPKEISQMLENGSINALSAVPTMLRLLLTHNDFFGEGRFRLKWIEIGSQPMGAEEKDTLRDLFPNACIVQHYGLTEASRTTLLRVDTAEKSSLASVGRTVGDTQVKIGKSGRIHIRGPHLASGLLIEGRIDPLPGDNGWFETSDLGILKADELYFKGRVDNLINCGGQKISSEHIEEQLAHRLHISKGFAVSRIPDDMYGDAILLCLENDIVDRFDEISQTAGTIIKEAGIAASGILKTFRCETLPVTDTGKVQRKHLVEQYLETLTSKQEIKKLPDRDASVLDQLRYKFSTRLKAPEVLDSDSFKDLGGDSITAVSLSMDIENILSFLPQNWRHMTIIELVRCANSTHSAKSVKEQNQVEAENLPLGAINCNPSDIRFWHLIKEDFITHEKNIFSQSFWAVFNNRFGNWRMSVKPKLLRAPLTMIYRIQAKLIQVFCGIKLDYTVKLGRRVKLEHFGGMILGAKSIGDDVTIRQNTTFGVKDLSDLQGKPTIEKGVNIGTGAVIVGDIVVGRYSVIGPNAIIDSDIPPFSVVSAPRSIVTTIK